MALPAASKTSRRWTLLTSWATRSPSLVGVQPTVARPPSGARHDLAHVAAVRPGHVDVLARRHIPDEADLGAVWREAGRVVVPGSADDEAGGPCDGVTDEDVAIRHVRDQAVDGRPERRRHVALRAGVQRDRCCHQDRDQREDAHRPPGDAGGRRPRGREIHGEPPFEGGPGGSLSGMGGPPEDVGEVVGRPIPATSDRAAGSSCSKRSIVVMRTVLRGRARWTARRLRSWPPAGP